VKVLLFFTIVHILESTPNTLLAFGRSDLRIATRWQSGIGVPSYLEDSSYRKSCGMQTQTKGTCEI